MVQREGRGVRGEEQVWHNSWPVPWPAHSLVRYHLHKNPLPSTLLKSTTPSPLVLLYPVLLFPLSYHSNISCYLLTNHVYCSLLPPLECECHWISAYNLPGTIYLLNGWNFFLMNELKKQSKKGKVGGRKEVSSWTQQGDSKPTSPTGQSVALNWDSGHD